MAYLYASALGLPPLVWPTPPPYLPVLGAMNAGASSQNT
jgi:hypothetical protein